MKIIKRQSSTYSRLLVIGLLFFIQSARAESGFLDDYSMLEHREGDAFNKVYIFPDTARYLKQFEALIVDQPEMFLSADSKYKGIKPDDLKELADVLRRAIVEEFEAGGYKTTDTPGANTIYMRWAVTDLYLKKKRRPLLSYTPTGFVLHTTLRAAIRNIWKKIDIVELNIEAEFFDVETEKRIGQVVLERGMRKAKGVKREIVDADELYESMQTFGARLVCMVDSARGEGVMQSECSNVNVESDVKKVLTKRKRTK